MKKIISGAALLLTNVILLPTSLAATPPVPSPNSLTSYPPPSASHFNYCPSANLLRKKGMWWGYRNWRSYSKSFASKITAFTGAQWSGVNVGNVICTYKGDKQFTFAITIQNSRLTYRPKGGLWLVANPTLLNCYSHSVYDCPFSFVEKQAPVDVYDVLRSFTPIYKHHDQDLQ